jgi:phospholipid transport system substrate-binding protein
MIAACSRTGEDVLRILAILMMLALLPARAGAASAVAAGTPAAVVDALQTALIAGLRSKQTCSARRERLQPVVMQAFDFDLIAQKLLRRHWQQLDDAQRQRFRDAIADTAITRYAADFVASDGDDKTTHFELLNKDAAAEGRVSARLLPASGDAVDFEYTLRKNGSDWKIVNVVAQGVSDLAVRSAQYEALIARSGSEELLKELETRNQQARAACASAP